MGEGSRLLGGLALGLVLACSTPGGPVAPAAVVPPPVMAPLARTSEFASVFADEGFAGSELEGVGSRGLFPARPASSSRVALLDNGDGSFAARIQALQAARKSIRIQALIFTGDESGLYIAELLKAKRAQGLDVRVIVDAIPA